MSFVKNHFLFVAFIFIFLVILIGSFLYTQNTPTIDTTAPTPSPNGALSSAPRTLAFNNIVPSTTTKEEVVKKLGSPIKEEAKNGNTVDFYKDSYSVNKQHEVYYQKNKVALVKENIAVDQKTIKDITAAYGEPKAVFYGPEAELGVYLYVLPEAGIAYLANREDGQSVLYEIWYFSPLSLKDFSSTWGAGYSPTLQINPEK